MRPLCSRPRRCGWRSFGVNQHLDAQGLLCVFRRPDLPRDRHGGAMTKKAAAKTKPAARVAPMRAADPSDLTAKAFIAKLRTFQSDDELRKIQRYFKSGEGQYAHGNTFIG